MRIHGSVIPCVGGHQGDGRAVPAEAGLQEAHILFLHVVCINNLLTAMVI